MAEFDQDEQFYRDTESIAFPKLDDRQLAMLEPLGTRRLLRGGETLFKAGQRDDFLDKNHIPHRLINSQSEYGRALCERLHLASHDLPALITANGMPLRHPSLREVARVAGLLRDPAREDQSEINCDLAIVGA